MESHYLKYLANGDDKDAILHDVMTEYGDDVWNFAYFLTRRKEAADDISQDVFLAVYGRMFSFRGECTMKSWLLTITRNKSLNYLKNAFIRKVTLVDYVLRNEAVPSAEKEMFDRLEVQHIWTMVMRLPRKYREVLLLDTHYELKIQDIAATLGLAEGTVKSRLSRARGKLTKMMDAGEQGGM